MAKLGKMSSPGTKNASQQKVKPSVTPKKKVTVKKSSNGTKSAR